MFFTSAMTFGFCRPAKLQSESVICSMGAMRKAAHMACSIGTIKYRHGRHFAKRNQIRGPWRRENHCLHPLIFFACRGFGQGHPKALVSHNETLPYDDTPKTGRVPCSLRRLWILRLRSEFVAVLMPFGWNSGRGICQHRHPVRQVSATMAQELYSKAALVNHEELARAQAQCELVKAESLMQDGFASDVRRPFRTGVCQRACRQ